MTTLLALAACAHRPATPLAAVPPPSAAPYRTDAPAWPLGSRYADVLARRVVDDAARLGAPVVPDAALSTVAERVAASLARDAPVSAATLQEWTADAGCPWVVDAVQAERRPGRRLPRDLAERLRVAELIGGSVAALGVGAVDLPRHGGRETQVVWLVARPRLILDQPMPPDGGALVIRTPPGFERVGAVSVDDRGLSEQFLPAAEVVELSARDPGWYEVVGQSGSALETLGLLRVGPELPTASSSPPDARDEIRAGLVALRARLGQPPLALVDGDPSCDARGPDVLGGIEVTRDQHCSMVPLFGSIGDPWDVVARRPMLLRTAADLDMDVLQIGVDRDAIRILTAGRFDRYTPAEAADQLHQRLAQRWPGLARADDPAFDALAAEWAETADPLGDAGMADYAARLDGLAAEWTSEPRYLRILTAAQTMDKLMRYVPATVTPTAAAVGVALGTGPVGEPMYYAAVALAISDDPGPTPPPTTPR